MGSVLLTRRAQPLPVAWFLTFATVIAAALRIAYSLTIAPEWTSDFGTYWKIAIDQVSSGNFQADSVYTERTLPVLVPVIALFGDTPYAVKAINIVMLGLVQLAGYDILRRLISHQTAQGFTIAFAAAPIPTFALTIPSHDLWAMFYLASAAWLGAVALTAPRIAKWSFSALIGTLLALICIVMEIQRGVGFLLALALVLASALTWALADRNNHQRAIAAKWLAMTCVVALAAQLPLGMLTSSLGLRAAESPAQTSRTTAYYATHATSLGNGTYGWMQEFQNQYIKPLRKEPERLSALSKSLIRSDWSEQPIKRVVNVSQRLHGLYVLDNSNFWYFANINPQLDVLRAWLSTYSASYSLFFALLLLASVLRMAMGVDLSMPTLACMTLLSVASLALASVSENQPRYILWIWFGGTLMIAEVLARRPSESPASIHRGATLLAASLGGWLALLLGLWALVAAGYGPAQGRILADWVDSETGRATGPLRVESPEKPYEHRTLPGKLAVALGPGEFRSVQHQYCVDEPTGPRNFTFFLRAESPTKSDALVVRHEAKVVRRIALAQAAKKAIDIQIPLTIPASGCGSVQLELAGTPTTRVVINFSRFEQP